MRWINDLGLALPNGRAHETHADGPLSGFLLSSCAWYPIARMPSDKEGALVVRCREVKGWFGRDSHWVMIVWVWSKSGALPDNARQLEIDSECQWSVEREAGPQITLKPLPNGSAESEIQTSRGAAAEVALPRAAFHEWPNGRKP